MKNFLWEVQALVICIYCCDRKFRAACEQNFVPWQQATMEIMLAISLTIACSRYIYNGVILHAHPLRGESHNQRNTTGEVATIPTRFCPRHPYLVCIYLHSHVNECWCYYRLFCGKQPQPTNISMNMFNHFNYRYYLLHTARRMTILSLLTWNCNYFEHYCRLMTEKQFSTTLLKSSLVCIKCYKQLSHWLRTKHAEKHRTPKHRLHSQKQCTEGRGWGPMLW